MEYNGERSAGATPGSSRRAVLRSGAIVAASLLVSCAGAGRRGRGRAAGPDASQDAGRPRFRARPGSPSPGRGTAALHRLGLGTARDGSVFAPAGAGAGEPLPLVLMLHGAGGDARAGLAPFLDQAEDAGVLLVAPESRGRTWDVLLGGWGQDVAFIERALEQTFSRYPVDPSRVAVEGFSDGASYALGLGLANGDLFGRIVAFSPGYVPRSPSVGRPPVFVSHGTGDPVLPIERCSRRIVPALRDAGHDVRYHEFQGGHEVPGDIAAEALALVTGAR